METILVSACLLGENCKYNGGNNYDPRIEKLKEKFDIILICPETFGGLTTPRVSYEIVGDRVISKDGKDVTKSFEEGANKALMAAKYLNVKKALLMDRSPSCGSTKIYNGKFNGTLINGMGVTASLLTKKGITVYTIDQIDELIASKGN